MKSVDGFLIVSYNPKIGYVLKNVLLDPDVEEDAKIINSGDFHTSISFALKELDMRRAGAGQDKRISGLRYKVGKK